jgi:hypothetical protein
MFKIEDVVSKVLIAGREQLFYLKNYNELLKSPVITTGNELTYEELVDLSKALDIKQLKSYVTDVMADTNAIIQNMGYEESKTKVSDERKEELIKTNAVAPGEYSYFLVDYWCGKTYAGLFLMPFSRHQMWHIDDCLKIMNRNAAVERMHDIVCQAQS